MVNYPCWSTFPYQSTGAGESAAKEISENNFQLLKEGDKNGAYWMPAMADAPLRGYNGRHEWFWEPGDEAHIFPLKNLMNIYYNSVGRNATLIMGLTPNPDGLLPQEDVLRLKEWGNEIHRRFSEPLARTSGVGDILTIHLPSEQAINHVIIQENIELGELIRSYEIEALVNDKWIKISGGQSIGQKRIEKFESITTSTIKLKILNSILPPEIVNFSIFNVKQ